MKPFAYARAADPADAVALAGTDPTAAYIAGGTELTNWMRDNLATPGLVIDLNGLDLSGVDWDGNTARIGGLARMSDVAADRNVRLRLKIVSDALLASASGQVRNMASIGGNLMQRTRCWYFRDSTMPCNVRQPGSGCPALEGENRWHAVLGGSDSCIKVHPSDLAVALTALDATLVLQGRDGVRRVPITEFYLLPGDTPQLETVLRHGELITGVEVPLSPSFPKSSYVKVRDRRSFEFAVVSVAALVRMDGRTVTDARFAFGGVAPRPWRVPEAEESLRGKRLTDETIAAAAELVVAGAVPREHNGFKVELVRRSLAKALREATR